MAMGRYSNKKKNLRNEMQERLSSMLKRGEGRSRHADKKAGTDKDKIYSVKTYETYKQQAFRFKDWLKENGFKASSLEEARPYADKWLQSQIDKGLSAWTIATARSALVKLYGDNDFIAPPSREREHIKRSRFKAKRDAHLSEEQEEKYAFFTSALGLRRNEMLHIKGTDLRVKDGRYYICVTKGAKGGKARVALVACPKEDLERLLSVFCSAGDRKVFPSLPSTYDNHHYRAEYAKRIYNHFARPKDAIPREDRYICRGDMKGVILDRKALEKVSLCLGHNRIDTSIAHYLYT